MNRSVLIITPYFAPQSHAAVFRAYKLAKYLPQLGWKPYVLTVDCNYLYNEDPTLVTELPPEVEVFTSRYVEPSLRGLRMALGGKDRTFKAVKAHSPGGPKASEPAGARRGRMSRVYEYVVRRWLNTPDAYWTWRRPALAAAREIIRKHNIPLVFTSADPYTSHLIGRQLQKEGCKWVADLRDPHAYDAHTASSFAAVHTRQMAAEREAVRNADAVTVASGSIAMIMTDMHGEYSGERFHFIPTGLDEQLLPTEVRKTRRYPYLVFTGEYLAAYGTGFLELFAEALQDRNVAQLGHKLLIVGRADVNSRILPAIRDLGLADRVEMIDHIPQRELYQLLAGAEAGVILSTPLFRWWCLYAKMVDYIAMKKPVIAVVPDPSEARTRLSKARLGVFLDGDRRSAVRTLRDFLSGKYRLPEPDQAECHRYLAFTQARSFADVFERLLFSGAGHQAAGCEVISEQSETICA